MVIVGPKRQEVFKHEFPAEYIDFNADILVKRTCDPDYVNVLLDCDSIHEHLPRVEELLLNARHLHVNVVILAESRDCLPRVVRANVDWIITANARCCHDEHREMLLLL